MANLLTRSRRRRCALALRCIIAVSTSALLAVPADVSAAALSGEQPSSCAVAQPSRLMDDGVPHGLSPLPTQAQPTPEQIADRLEKLFSIVAEADRQIPRDTFDPQAIIDKVGKGPTKIFEWVRDHTYFVPYRGLLRGDKGVLMDRLGNSVDRAMLLYSLLQFAGQPVRLAHGTLTEAQAQDVLKRIRPFPSFEQRIGSSWSPTITSTLAKQYAQENQLDLAEIRKEVQKLAAQEKATELKVKSRVPTQTAAIAAAVGHPPASVADEERTEQVRSITDHWWVQCQSGGNWTNLDPTLPSSLPGQTLAVAQNTVAPKSHMDVGENLVHTVEIKVVIEIWKQGQVKEATAFSHTLVPAEEIGAPIVLRQIPVHWPEDLNLFQEKDPVAAFKKTALAQTEWSPVLTVGSQNFSKYSFNDAGDLDDPTSPLAHAEEQGVGGLAGAIGGMLSSHQIAPAPKPTIKTQPGQLTAEWIDYTIQTPGKQPQTIRREIFDLIGPAARATGGAVPGPQMTDTQKLDRALSLTDTVDILPVVAQPSPAYILHSTNESLLSNRASALKLIRESGSSESRDFVDDLGNLKPVVSGQLDFLAFARFEWGRNQSTAYLDRPNILAFHKQPRARGRSLTIEEGFDIVSHDVAVSPDSRTEPFLVRLEQGVLDTNAEAALAGPEHDVGNTANAFAESMVEKEGWVTVKGKDSSALLKIELPRDVRSRVLNDLRNGDVVVVPHGNGTAQIKECPGGCWWRVDPRTGETLGIGYRGWGQTAAEWVRYLRIATTAVQMAGCFVAAGVHSPYIFACFLVGMLKAASLTIGGANLAAGIYALGADIVAIIVLATKMDWSKV